MNIQNIDEYEKQFASTQAHVVPGTKITTHTALILRQSFSNFGMEPQVPNEVENNTINQGSDLPDYWNRRTIISTLPSGEMIAEPSTNINGEGCWNYGYGTPRDEHGNVVKALMIPNPT